MVSSAETSSRHDPPSFVPTTSSSSVVGGFSIRSSSVFYRRQGLSGTEIGIIGTTQAVAALVAAPLWGRWSDASVGAPFAANFILLTAILTPHSRAAKSILAHRHHRLAHYLGRCRPGTVVRYISAGRYCQSHTQRGLWQHSGIRFAGWALVTTFSGRLIELSGMFVGFVGNATGMLASAVILFFLPRVSPGHQSQTDTIPAELATKQRGC